MASVATKPVPSADDPDVHRTMDDAPRDGRWIEVTEDFKTWVRARFYQTRMRRPGAVPWVVATCWSTSEPRKFANRVAAPAGWREDRGAWG